MKYFRSGLTFHAIKPLGRGLFQVFSCNNSGAHKSTSVQNRTIDYVRYLENLPGNTDLTEEEFQLNFSEAIDFLHTQTPFA